MFFNSIGKRLENEIFSLVVDGKSLADIMINHAECFLDICLQCDAVLCCRMSPGQKADVCISSR